MSVSTDVGIFSLVVGGDFPVVAGGYMKVNRKIYIVATALDLE